MRLPEHKYYTLKQAAKKAECEIEDLIHFAAIGLLQLCVKVPPVELMINPYSDNEEPIDIEVWHNFSLDCDDIRKLLEEEEKSNPIPTGIDKLSEEGEDVFYFNCHYSSDYFSLLEHCSVKKNPSEYEGLGIEDDNFEILDWSGLLAIPCDSIEIDEIGLATEEGRKISVIELYPPRGHIATCKPSWFGVESFRLSRIYEFGRYELYITKYEFDLLIRGGLSVYSGESIDKETVFPLQEKIDRRSGVRKEICATNREGLYKDAIYILSRYPDECRGEKKEISPGKWRECIFDHVKEVEPLSIRNEETVLKKLQEAVNHGKKKK
ncbi:hypothetical protein BW014_12465 [Salmonella enterica]|nr:hypothetical protein [Salmonella enterica]ECG3783133.1 hypothetical protein [Salmonella enterica subsp. enterica serovar Florida]EBG9725417.1 hypothetical protein [Salmonella enterica]ECT8478210.1 hypothetical protein [Salmonella enterica]EDU2037431.1 hypothetical protein [Salmonella enterica subsp. enterica serovar Florida]